MSFPSVRSWPAPVSWRVPALALALFVATLWLLTRWWDGGLTFVRHHVRTYCAVLGLVAAGLAVAPGTAMPEYYGGRLVGALWPLTPPQIGQYAAVVTGLTVLLLLTQHLPFNQPGIFSVFSTMVNAAIE